MLPLKALVQGKLKGHRKIQTPAETSRDKIKDRKSTRLNSSHGYISYAVFCLKKKKLQASPSVVASLFAVSAVKEMSCLLSSSHAPLVSLSLLCISSSRMWSRAASSTAISLDT